MLASPSSRYWPGNQRLNCRCRLQYNTIMCSGQISFLVNISVLLSLIRRRTRNDKLMLKRLSIEVIPFRSDVCLTSTEFDQEKD